MKFDEISNLILILISRQTIEMLNSLDAKYGSFDILSDESVRQGLKTYSNWPTYPQLYVKGKYT